jgi:hypothetical protein
MSFIAQFIFGVVEGKQGLSRIEIRTKMGFDPGLTGNQLVQTRVDYFGGFPIWTEG